MKSRHKKIIAGKLRDGDLPWFARQARKYLSVPVSNIIGRPLSGPILGGIFLTYRCGYRCLMCDLPGRQGRHEAASGREMNTDEIKRVVDEFAALGTSGIGIDGGEPLMRPDLEEIVAYIHGQGMAVSVASNGFLLTAERARRLLATGVDNIQVSLDAPLPELHDRIRGVPGAYRQTTQHFRSLVAERNAGGFRTRLFLSMCLNLQNYHHAIEMVEHARGLGADSISFVGFEALALSDRLDQNRGMLLVDEDSRKDAETVMDALIAMRKRSGFIDNSVAGLRLMKWQIAGSELPIRCHANFTSLFVDCFGDVFPCLAFADMNRPIHNLRDGPLGEFWVSREYGRIRKELSRCRKCFFPCNSEISLLFNPGRALYRAAPHPRSGE